MSQRPSLRDLLHWATHQVPGIPAHTTRPAGHQGQARHDHGRRHSPTRHRAHQQGFNHSPGRPPRVLAAWQTRIARLFGQELG